MGSHSYRIHGMDLVLQDGQRVSIASLANPVHENCSRTGGRKITGFRLVPQNWTHVRLNDAGYFARRSNSLPPTILYFPISVGSIRTGVGGSFVPTTITTIDEGHELYPSFWSALSS